MILKQRDQQSENEYEGSMFIIGVLSARKQANKNGNERQTAAQMLQNAAECCRILKLQQSSMMLICYGMRACSLKGVYTV